ncbi:MAG: PLP-dependent aminotransferase family protein, partial [Nitrosomonadales bacterium]|nr:PLP-dependent aminotransferase family protein [Nitrosomonadales bacterium]
KTLNVNRKTIVLAYEELIAQGWLVTEKRRGTFVAEDLSAFPDYKAHLSATAQTDSVDPTINPLSGEHMNEYQQQPTLIDFTDGVCDNRLVPLETFSRAFRKALLVATRAGHQFGNPQGALGLRNAIANMLNMEKNFRIDASQVCVVSSNQMAIFIIARLLTKSDDCVVFERLSNPLARQAFESCGANIEYVDIDRYGADIDQIAHLAAKRKIRAVYVTPQHQFPTAVMMTSERRKALLRLAEHHGFYIIEDDREHEFYFDETLPFPLASMEDSNRTIYMGSLSNVLSPALEVSYLIGEKALIEQCVTEKNLMECQNKLSLEYAAYELMESGEMQRHRRRISKVYAERRQLMQELIQNELDDHIEFDLPKGGLAFWLRLRHPVDRSALIKQSLKEKVRFSHGSQFSPENEEVRAIRLGFASLNQKELRVGIRRVKQALMASCMSLMALVIEPMMH